jgi:hypothetical protein
MHTDLVDVESAPTGTTSLVGRLAQGSQPVVGAAQGSGVFVAAVWTGRIWPSKTDHTELRVQTEMTLDGP